ncbi:SPOR domain-containing protein [Frateuria aurantia]
MKTRLLGAAVLIALAVIFVPMFFSSNPTPAGGDKNVSLDIPSEPSGDMQTQTMDLTSNAPPAGHAAQSATVPPPPAAGPAVPAVTAASTPAAAPPPASNEPVIPHNNGNGLARVEMQSRRPTDVETGDGSQPVIPDRRRHPVAEAAPPPAPTPVRAAATPAPASVAATAGVATHGHYSLNLSAYASADSARNLIARVRALGYPAQARAMTQSGRTLALVTAGPFESRAAAEAARLKITQGIPGVPAHLQSGASDQAGDAAPPPARAAAASAAPARAGGWAVQLAAMGTQGDANALRDRLRANGFDAYVDSVAVSGRRLWRVRAGPQTQRADAARVRDQIRGKLGLAGNIVSAP